MLNLILFRSVLHKAVDISCAHDAGNFQRQAQGWLALHDGIVRFIFNPRLEPTIPTHVRAQVDSTREALDD
jgi:Na+-transporting NADH:ubiquinone oxidoreductase subunit NqrB